MSGTIFRDDLHATIPVCVQMCLLDCCSASEHTFNCKLAATALSTAQKVCVCLHVCVFHVALTQSSWPLAEFMYRYTLRELWAKALLAHNSAFAGNVIGGIHQNIRGVSQQALPSAGRRVSMWLFSILLVSGRKALCFFLFFHEFPRSGTLKSTRLE